MREVMRLFGACLPRGPSGASAPLLAPATRAPATRSAPQAGHPRSTSTTRPCLSQTGAGWCLSSTWGVGFRTVVHCTLTSRSVSLLFLPARVRLWVAKPSVSVTGASNGAEAPDAPLGRQAPNSLSTSLQNILRNVNDELRNELRTSYARVSQRVSPPRFVYILYTICYKWGV